MSAPEGKQAYIFGAVCWGQSSEQQQGGALRAITRQSHAGENLNKILGCACVSISMPWRLLPMSRALEKFYS